MIARASSGSRSSINSVEPLMSANSAVTVLRSPSSAEVSASSATTRMSPADFRAAEIPLAALSCLASDAPHLPQKFEEGEFSAPQFAQGCASELPHRAQKLLS